MSRPFLLLSRKSDRQQLFQRDCVTEVRDDLTSGTDIPRFQNFKITAGLLLTAYPVDGGDITDAVKDQDRMFRMHTAAAAVFCDAHLCFCAAGIIG